jgi:hypothetical protein
MFLEQLTARLAVQKQSQELQLLSPLERVVKSIQDDLNISNSCMVHKYGTKAHSGRHKLGTFGGNKNAPSKEVASQHTLMAQHHHVHALGSMRSTPEQEKAHAEAEKAHLNAAAGKAKSGEVDTAEKAVADSYTKAGKTAPEVARPDAKPEQGGKRFDSGWTPDSKTRSGGKNDGMTSERAGEMGMYYNENGWDTHAGHMAADRSRGLD